jgi:hypothetical protein
VGAAVDASVAELAQRIRAELVARPSAQAAVIDSPEPTPLAAVDAPPPQVPGARAPPARRRASWLLAGIGVLSVTGALLILIPLRPGRLDPDRVLVAGLENRTGDASLAVLGDIAADYVACGIAGTRLARQAI